MNWTLFSRPKILRTEQRDYHPDPRLFTELWTNGLHLNNAVNPLKMERTLEPQRTKDGSELAPETNQIDCLLKQKCQYQYFP